MRSSIVRAGRTRRDARRAITIKGEPHEVGNAHSAEPDTMIEGARSIEANKQLVRRFVQAIFVDGDADAVDELVAEDFVPHTWPSTGDGRADLKRAIERVSKSLSDPSFTIEDMIAENDRVAVRLTASARQTGEFMGIPPSGKSYTIGEIHIFRIRDGKVTEHWHHFDQMGMMRQLGALPGQG